MDDYSLVEIKALCKNYYYLNSISEAKLDLDLALQSVLIDRNESEYIKLVYGCGLNISQYLDFADKSYREYKDIDQSVFAKLKALMNDEIRVFSNRKRCNPFDVDADLRARIRGVLVEDNDELMLNYLNITIDDRPMVGEGNNPEVVIPLANAKRSRAMELLAKTKNILGDKDAIIVNNNNDNNDLKSLESKFDMLISIATALLNKEVAVNLDGRKLNKAMEDIKTRNAIQKNRGGGLITA